jgi:hypothetical protein
LVALSGTYARPPFTPRTGRHLWIDALPSRDWPVLVLAVMAVVVALKARSRHKHLSVEWEGGVAPDNLR